MKHGFGLALVAAALISATSAPMARASTMSSLPAGPEPVTVMQAGPAVGLTIPWAVGGLRFDRSGSTISEPEAWPAAHVDAVRLWDTRTAWLNLEPRDDAWRWDNLDAHVAKAEAEGVQKVTLVLAGTPRWAAARESVNDAPWMGSGSASPPADPEQWRDFVDHVVERYAGRIDAYEIGNEPNLAMFWNGSPEEFATHVAIATEAIRAGDPDATVVVDAALVRSARDASAPERWLGPLAALGVRPDAISFHLYPAAPFLEQVPRLIRRTMASIALAGFGDLPVWVTEVNVLNGASMAADHQAEAVDDIGMHLRNAGIDHVYWYAWTQLGPQDLMPLGPGTPAALALLHS